MATVLLLIIYLTFISLGLPDAMLGAAWPAMHADLSVPYGLAGLLQMIVSAGTIVSSLLTGQLVQRVGTGKLTAFSVGLTALALFGFSQSPSFVWLLLAAVPLGLGGGAVDAALNAFVSTQYAARHMNWLHCFWGVGALTGPLVLAFFLSAGQSWRSGYLLVGSERVRNLRWQED